MDARPGLGLASREAAVHWGPACSGFGDMPSCALWPPAELTQFRSQAGAAWQHFRAAAGGRGGAPGVRAVCPWGGAGPGSGQFCAWPPLRAL